MTTVSLVLGGGGARGLAHIGVIHWLIENGYAIRSISGSSMGALVGGMYAAGKLGVYAEWVLALKRIDVVRLLDPAFGRTGLFKGERIMRAMRGLVGDHDIEDLPIAYTAVATDQTSGSEVWFQKGKLFDAIRASIAAPMFFTPFRHGERTFVDGALVNPVPISPTLNDGTDLTVVVRLCGPPAAPSGGQPVAVPAANSYWRRVRALVDGGAAAADSRDAGPRGLVSIALSTMQVMQDRIAELSQGTYAPDVIVTVPRDSCGYHEFWRAEELISLGRERATSAFGALERPCAAAMTA